MFKQFFIFFLDQINMRNIVLALTPIVGVVQGFQKPVLDAAGEWRQNWNWKYWPDDYQNPTAYDFYTTNRTGYKVVQDFATCTESFRQKFNTYALGHCMYSPCGARVCMQVREIKKVNTK